MLDARLDERLVRKTVEERKYTKLRPGKLLALLREKLTKAVWLSLGCGW